MAPLHALLLAGAAAETVRFALPLGSHMVLQRDVPTRVWGFADAAAGAVVNVSLDDGAWAVGYVGANGTWTAELPPQPATPVSTTDGVVSAAPGATITARLGNASAVLEDVIFGEVWLCSGQSNMAFLLKMAFDAEAEEKKADLYPAIRYATVTKVSTRDLQSDVPGMAQNWSVGSSATISQPDSDDDDWIYNSAVCYLYAQEVLLGLNASVAVGVVGSDWGGTDIESWSSPAAIRECPGSEVRDFSIRYNSMLYPLRHMSLKGAIWYQGEANAGASELYACQLPALINDWRALFNNTDLFFGFVNLAGFVSDDLEFPLTRWRMQTATELPNTFSATAYDLGDADSPYGSVHPRYKRDVAERLARGGLAVAYGLERSWTGPVATGAAPTAGSVTVSFENCGDGLVLTDVNATVPQTNWSGTRVFEVCASGCDPESLDGDVWREVDAALFGACAVALNASEAAAVRFAWRGYPCDYFGCGLYGSYGDLRLPPQPFLLNVTA